MAFDSQAEPGGASKGYRTSLIVVALILVAVNLRLAITSAASLLTLLEESGAIDAATMVVIPAIPTAIFALAGVSTSWLATRFGIERSVAAGMIVLTLGLVVRVIPEPWAVLAGTIVATGGLAIVNILMPAVVRSYFGRQIGPLTTVYTVTMSLGSAAGAAAAVPIAQWFGDPSLGLAAWAIPAILGTVVWIFAVPMRPAAASVTVLTETGSIAVVAGRRGYPTGTALLAGYFAMQALLSYVIMGWLPAIGTDAGLPEERAGLLLGIAMLVGVPATMIVVALTRGVKRMRVAFIFIGVTSMIGSLGMLVAPTVMPEIWAVFLGLGMSGFPVVIALIASIGRDAVESARVSTLVQASGYTVATVGPLGAGALYQLSGGWSVVLVLLIVCAVLQCVIGLLITRVVAPPGQSARRIEGTPAR